MTTKMNLAKITKHGRVGQALAQAEEKLHLGEATHVDNQHIPRVSDTLGVATPSQSRAACHQPGKAAV